MDKIYKKNRGLLNSNNNKRKRQIKGDKGGIKTVWGMLDKDKRPRVKWDKELKVSENRKRKRDKEGVTFYNQCQQGREQKLNNRIKLMSDTIIQENLK